MSREESTRTDDTVTVIVLAGGAGTRFRDVGHKLLARLPATAARPAEPVAHRAVAAAVAADIGPVVVVTGRLAAADIGVDDPAVETVHNADWPSGQMTSVRAGLDIADRNGSSIAVIGLADQPGIDPAAWRVVAGAARAGRLPITVATYDGTRGNPVALHRSVWELLATEGDEGARSLMRIHPELVREVPCTGSPTDIDTAEDLRRWQSS